MFKKMAVVLAASTMALTSTAAQANSASALSLRGATVQPEAARAATPAKKGSKLDPSSPLVIILGAIGVVTLLEVTGVIDIFNDSPDSP